MQLILDQQENGVMVVSRENPTQETRAEFKNQMAVNLMAFAQDDIIERDTLDEGLFEEFNREECLS